MTRSHCRAATLSQDTSKRHVSFSAYTVMPAELHKDCHYRSWRCDVKAPSTIALGCWFQLYSYRLRRSCAAPVILKAVWVLQFGVVVHLHVPRQNQVGAAGCACYKHQVSFLVTKARCRYGTGNKRAGHVFRSKSLICLQFPCIIMLAVHRLLLGSPSYTQVPRTRSRGGVDSKVAQRTKWSPPVLYLPTMELCFIGKWQCQFKSVASMFDYNPNNSSLVAPFVCTVF